MIELWKEQLEKLQQKVREETEISILDDDVTGAIGIEKSPDNLFYSEFSEEDASMLFDIFSNFKDMFDTNRHVAVSTLEDNLKEQLGAMPQKLCPIEVLLYSSRLIKEQIYDEKKVFKLLKSIVAQKLYHVDGYKSAEYILSGWEWIPQLSILIEAIGENNDSLLIALAMDYYTTHAKKCGTDTRILKAYLNMLLATQNEEYLDDIVYVVTDAKFMEDGDLVNTFFSMLQSGEFLRNEPIFSNITKLILDKPLSSSMRIALNQCLKKKQQRDDSIIKNMDSGLSPERKEAEIATLQFGRTSSLDLTKCEKVRDADSNRLVCGTIMKRIDDIYPDEQRGRAYVLLGTKGRWLKNEIVDFLMSQRKNKPEFACSVNIALYSLEIIDSTTLFDSLFVNTKDFYVKNLGRYFRYNSQLLAVDFLSYVSRVPIDNPGKEGKIINTLLTFHQVLNEYNGNNDKINDSSIALADKVIDMLMSYNGKYSNRGVFDAILDIVELIMRVCSSKGKKICGYLDIVKGNVSGVAATESIKLRINKLIKKGELPSEPD